MIMAMIRMIMMTTMIRMMMYLCLVILINDYDVGAASGSIYRWKTGKMTSSLYNVMLLVVTPHDTVTDMRTHKHPHTRAHTHSHVRTQASACSHRHKGAHTEMHSFHTNLVYNTPVSDTRWRHKSPYRMFVLY